MKFGARGATRWAGIAVVGLLLAAGPGAVAAAPRSAVENRKAAVPADAIAPGGVTAVDPVRLLDTRTDGGCLTAGATRSVQVTGVGGVPAGTGTVTLNLTAAAPTAAGFLTVYPTGATRPATSNLNFLPHDLISNLVVVAVGAGGNVSIYNLAGCTQVIVDLNGWSSAGPAAPGGLTGVQPARLLDTRVAGQGPCVGPRVTRTLDVTGVGGVPADGVGAVALNVTAVAPTAAGFLSIFPSGSTPGASNLNFTPGQVVPNMVMVQVGAAGKVGIYNALGCTHVVVDVVGWFRAGGPSVGGFAGMTPIRLLDTRATGGGGCRPAGSTLSLPVLGHAMVPATGVAAVVVNVTAVAPTAAGFLTVFPDGRPRPPTSNVNFPAGRTIPDLVLAKVGADGAISIYNFAGCTHLVVDVFGWISSVDSVTFGPVQEVDLDGSATPHADAIADVTGDGRPDLIEARYDVPSGASAVVVYPGTGSGLGKGKSYSSDRIFSLYSMAVGDLDGDGLADIALATEAGVDLYLQRDGKLTNRKLLRTGPATSVQIVDVDGNGDPDLVFNGGGWIDDVLAPQIHYLATPGGGHPHFGDVTGDGLPDFVGSTATQIVVAKQLPGLQFAAPITLTPNPAGQLVGDVAVGDVTGDGLGDIVATVLGTGDAKVDVFAQTTTGFAPPVPYAAADVSLTGGLAVARVSGDDRLDVVAATGGITAAAVFIQGDTGLAGPLRLSDPTGGGYEPGSVAVGDLDGDGLADIALANDDGRFRLVFQR